MPLRHNHFEHFGIYLSELFTVCMFVCVSVFISISHLIFKK